ncbi:MAG: homing endonuclease associated repeat-containing protein [Candidatus Methylacidiphilales bacterium]
MITRSRKNKKWSAQLVLDEIRSWETEGKALYSHHVRQEFQELLAAGIRYYGSWKSAVEAAGIPYQDVRKYQNWSKDLIVQKIQELRQQGVDLSFRSMMLSRFNSMVYAAIRPNHFGSWKAALSAAGLPPDEIYRYRSWDEDTILSEIRKLKEQGADLSSKTMDETSNPLIATARRRFGNWGNAVEKAGIDYSAIRRRRRWTCDDIIEGILELRSQGVKMQSNDVRKASPALFAAACKPRFFGTWSKALSAALEHEKASVTEVAMSH